MVAGDGKVRDAFSNKDLISTYERLSDFIESDRIQSKLKDLDLTENIGEIVEAIKQFENDNSGIMTFISNNLGEAILWKIFSYPSTPDDTDEATITGYGEAEDTEFDFDESGFMKMGSLEYRSAPKFPS